MKKILMIILDGFGIRDNNNGNAVIAADMKHFQSLWDNYPHSVLEASGPYVGLPEGIFGNSEVGHTVIGLGKKIKQKISIATEEIESKNIITNEEYLNLIKHVKDNNSTLHLMGLVSDGGVHSNLNYILKLIPLLKESGIKKIAFHAITDGRDTSPTSSLTYLNQLDEVLKNNKIGHIATVCGRFYAMDRDNKWERTQKYYNMLISGIGYNILSLENAIKNSYLKGITDEFLPPLIVNKDSRVENNDALLWLNFRPDRSRQIMNSLSNPNFNNFKKHNLDNFKTWMLFKQEDVINTNFLLEMETEDLYPLGQYFSDLNFTQARIAETEKYAHVTTFFNAEKSSKFPNSDNFLIPSPKVNTYDETPIMSAREVSKQVQKCLEQDYDFILVNYANPDMVGHTGNFEATTSALKYLDILLKEVIDTATDNFYKVIILADHGNADYMLDEENNIVTTHSMSPVPFIIVDKHVILKEKGDLTMVAPSLLKYMDIAIPQTMKESKILIIEDN